MKKMFFALFVISAILLQSCSSSIEGFENYQEACAAARFDVAHRFLAKMPKDDSSEKDAYKEAERYILKEEIGYLVSLGDEQYNNKIIFLLKQYELSQIFEDSKTKFYIMAMDMATACNNNELMETLIQNTPLNSYSIDRFISYYTKAGDEKLRSFLFENLSEGVVTNYAKKYSIEKNDVEMLNKLIIQNPYLANNEEIMIMLAQSNPKQFRNFIEQKITDAENSIPSRPALGVVKYDDIDDLKKDYSEYVSGVEKYNNECKEALTKAIQAGDKTLANNIVNRMKPNLEWKELGDWEQVVNHSKYSSIYEAYKVTQSNYDDINSAKQMLRDAKF